MRLLLIGGTGFIGSAVARALIADGHELDILARDIRYGRRILPQANWRHGDLNTMTDAAAWTPHLQGVDAVINASGLLQGGAGDAVRATQADAIIAMSQAAATASVARIIQISAAGIAGNRTDFMATKLAADTALLQGPVPALVLRPGLVIGRNAYGGTELIRMAAALPVVMRLTFGRSIRCIALDDVVDAVRKALARAALPDQPIDLVGCEVHDLDTIVAAHRRWMALPPARLTLPVPRWAITTATRCADGLGCLGWRSPLRSNAVAALEHGVDGNPGETCQWLEREPLSVDAILARMQSGKQDRITASINLWMPLALAALFIMWAVSGIATLAHLPDAAGLIAKGGISPLAAHLLAVGGAILDLALAFALLWRPTARLALIMMALVTLVYLVLGSVMLPQLWSDPLAPLAKALPAQVLALILLPVIERR